MQTDHAAVQFAGDGFLVATTPSGHAQTLDIQGERNAAPGPFELLLVALGGCTAADVISVLQKKREKVTAYRVEVRGERREEHPRALRRVEVRHIVRGIGVSRKAVAQAVELSTTRYCGVVATVRPSAEIVTSFEIQEDERPT
jgi:putative redox protein